MRIPGLRGHGPTRLLKHALLRFLAHDMPTHAAAITFHLLFSLFPFIIFFIALLGYLELSQLFDWLRRQFQAFLLEQTMGEINQVLDRLQQRRVGILSAGAFAALWAASSAMRSMMNALNVIYDVVEERPLWKRYALSVFYTLIIGSMNLVAVILMLAAPQAIETLARHAGVIPSLSFAWAWWLRWPVVVLLLTAAIALVFGAGPDVEQRFRFVTPGAFLAVVTWIAASAAFNFYVRHVAHYDLLYGSVGTIIVLLLYFFISALILLFGAEVNAVVENLAPDGKNAGDKILK